MKKLEFETSKGKFVLIDAKDISTSWYYFMNKKLKLEYNIQHEFKLGKTIFKLEGIAEDELSNIVQSHNGMYNTYTEEEFGGMTSSSMTSLRSLLESKGVQLFENKFGKLEEAHLKYIVDCSWKEAEQKTFYNPYIFKI